MKEIPLTQGQVALVDDEDYEKLMRHKWFAYKHRLTFYAARSVQVTPGYGGNRLTRMHYDIIGVPKHPMVTDHIDGNGLNNQKSNLRFVTNIENTRNTHRHKTSKYTGVSYCWVGRRKHWHARIPCGGRLICIGYYFTEEEARDKRKAWEDVIGCATSPRGCCFE